MPPTLSIDFALNRIRMVATHSRRGSAVIGGRAVPAVHEALFQRAGYDPPAGVARSRVGTPTAGTAVVRVTVLCRFVCGVVVSHESYVGRPG